MNFDWTIVIGWTAYQWKSEDVMYNLTLTPFIYTALNTNSSLNVNPFSIHVDPYFMIFDYKFPWSIQFINNALFCVDWNAFLSPMTFGSYLGTSFLECWVDLAEEDTGSCDYSPLVSTRFWRWDLYDGTSYSIIDQQCYSSTS